MLVPLILALLAAVLPQRAFASVRTSLARPNRWRAEVAFAAAAVLVASFAAYEFLFDQTLTDLMPMAVRARLPVTVLIAGMGGLSSASRADELLLLALAEAAALGLFLRCLGALERRAYYTIMALVALSMALIALAVRASGSSDLYLYVGLATLGAGAYAPPPVTFAGDLHIINAIWGTPLLPSAYGPVWIGLSALLLAPLSTLWAKLFALRLLGLASIATAAYLAHRLGATRGVVAGIACNPALHFLYVASAHNDLFAVNLVLAAMLAARRSAILAFGFALAAGLVKVTLAPLALVAVVAFPSLRKRIAFAILLAIAVAAAYASDGGIIWRALVRAAGYAPQHSLVLLALRLPLILVALATPVLAVAARRVRPQNAWALAALGNVPRPWYEIWGLPLVLGSTPVAMVYLVTLPFLTFFYNRTLPDTQLIGLSSFFFVLAAVVVAVRRLLKAAAVLGATDG